MQMLDFFFIPPKKIQVIVTMFRLNIKMNSNAYNQASLCFRNFWDIRIALFGKNKKIRKLKEK